MVLAGTHRPLTEIEDLELRRDRLAELIRLDLVSPFLMGQITKAVTQLDVQIAEMRAAARAESPMRIAA